MQASRRYTFQRTGKRKEISGLFGFVQSFRLLQMCTHSTEKERKKDTQQDSLHEVVAPCILSRSKRMVGPKQPGESERREPQYATASQICESSATSPFMRPCSYVIDTVQFIVQFIPGITPFSSFYVYAPAFIADCKQASVYQSIFAIQRCMNAQLWRTMIY